MAHKLLTEDDASAVIDAEADGLHRSIFDHSIDDLRLSDPIGALREQLDLDDDVSDVTIAASLAAIAATGDPRARWLAAFSSPLGKWLAARGTDLNTALNVMMALAPKSS